MALRYLIDTDVCVAALDDADPRVRARWIAASAAQIAMCSVVRAELEAGAWGTRNLKHFRRVPGLKVVRW